jgi:phosphoribosyl 1,2-cyclic phosphodiesterase
MQLSVLNSGSNANATVVVEDGHALVIDCGLSAREFLKRLEGAFGEVEIDGILLTHEHSDHIGGVRPLHKKTEATVYLTHWTLFRNEKEEEAGKPRELLRSVDVHELVQMERYDIGPFVVTPIPVFHDANDPVGYRIESAGKVITIATDLGYINHELKESLADSNVVVLEANHDMDMLVNGRYPDPLIARIAGKEGHLSNYDSAVGIGNAHPSIAYLAHISKDNNTPQKAETTVLEHIEERDIDTEVFLTYRDKATKPIEVP